MGKKAASKRPSTFAPGVLPTPEQSPICILSAATTMSGWRQRKPVTAKTPVLSFRSFREIVTIWQSP